MNTIRQTTLKVCIEEQKLAALSYKAARKSMLGWKQEAAQLFQQDARKHYDEAWMRLERLI